MPETDLVFQGGFWGLACSIPVLLHISQRVGRGKRGRKASTTVSLDPQAESADAGTGGQALGVTECSGLGLMQWEMREAGGNGGGGT